MATVLEQVENAINRGEAEQARELLREELLSNPTAEAYYLASLVAFDEAQQREFLEKALAIYPFHKKAYTLLKRIDFKRAKAAESRSEIPSATEPPLETPGVVQPAEMLDLAQQRSTVLFPYAPISKRFTANFIDGVALIIFNQMVLSVLTSFGLLPPSTVPYFDVRRLSIYDVPNPPYLLISFVLGTLISSIYCIYFLCEQNGQTPGKYLRGIRIVSLTGDKITRRQAFVRNVIGYWISGFFLIGYLWAFWDKNRQTWHDKFAKTIVVKTS